MQTLIQDLRYATRMLCKNPGFTAVAVLTLALGIGANTAIFSVINGVLLKPLPYELPGQLVMVWEDPQGDGSGKNGAAGGVFLDWKEQSKSFEAMSVIYDLGTAMNLSGADQPERLHGWQVSASFLRILRVTPLLGRGFAPDEDQLGHDNKVVVIAHRLWQRRFGSDTNIVGRTIRLNGEPYTVIGVLPPKALLDDERQFLIPFVFGTENWQKSRGDQRFLVYGRLNAGVNVEQATIELKAIKQRLIAEYPKWKEKWGARVIPLHEEMTGNVKPTLILLLGAVGLVLLIAGANVANLLLAKATSRQKEMAVRVALGASRWRVARQVLTESVVLALLGGGLGVALAFGSEKIFSQLGEVSLDGRVLGCTLLVSFATGIVFGFIPALQVSAPGVNNTLKESGRGSTSGTTNRIRGGLIVSEVALALTLLVGASLLLKSFWRLWSTPTGFNPKGALVLDISLPEAKYPDGENRARFLARVFQRLEALPGIEAASITTTTPMIGGGLGSPVSVEGRANQPEFGYNSNYDFVGGRYFRAMGIPLLRGRDFEERDNTTNAPQVCIFNETLAKTVFPDEDPIGKRILFWGSAWEIIGVAGSIRADGLNYEPSPRIYLPQVFSPWSGSLVVRAKQAPLALAETIRKEILSLDSDQPVSNIRTLEQDMARSVVDRRLTLTLLGVFASLAVGLAAIGLYGVMAYVVTQRTHEIGIRMALGARQTDVLKLVVKQGMRLTFLGVASGLVCALGLTRVIANQLYEVETTDPTTFGGVSLLLAVVALFACWLPARRAAKVDPMEALRYE